MTQRPPTVWIRGGYSPSQFVLFDLHTTSSEGSLSHFGHALRYRKVFEGFAVLERVGTDRRQALGKVLERDLGAVGEGVVANTGDPIREVNKPG
jgi:hypothetical protein